MASPRSASAHREIPLALAVVPVLALIVFLSLVILVLPARYPEFSGTGHLPLILAATIAAVIGRRFGHGWNELQDGILDAIRMAMGAILILLVIGMLMGTWIIAGIVPTLVHWGLELLHPTYFLPTTCIVCSIVSVVSGSSWSTAGTVGLALIGVGNAMGIAPAMTAGAVVSGAYFGDKMSPMSDTTNLAPAMAGAELFAHIRHMLFTTGPSWIVAMIVYVVLSSNTAGSTETQRVLEIQRLIEDQFSPGWIHAVPPALVLGLVLLRQPALPSLFVGVLTGAVGAVVMGAPLPDVINASLSGYVANTGHPDVDELLSRGGMMSMADTVFLILSAMVFGGVMERTGMLETMALSVLKLARNTGSLIATAVLTAAGMNIVAADQYISIVVPGRMYADAFRSRGLAAKNLSRALEDGGTITSPLIPWNTCGAFMSATLMVPTFAYLPYAVLNYVNPIVSIILGFTGWTIARLPAHAGPASREPAISPARTAEDHSGGGQP